MALAAGGVGAATRCCTAARGTCCTAIVPYRENRGETDDDGITESNAQAVRLDCVLLACMIQVHCADAYPAARALRCCVDGRAHHNPTSDRGPGEGAESQRSVR